MNKKVILMVALVGLIGFGVWYFSDKQIVQRKAHAFVDSFEKEEGDGLLSGVLSESGFRDLLDKRVALNFNQRDMPDMRGGIKHDREHLANNYLYVMKSAKMIKLTDTDIELKSIDKNNAEVEISLHGEVKHRSYSLNSDVEMILLFKKTEEGWRITSITVTPKR